MNYVLIDKKTKQVIWIYDNEKLAKEKMKMLQETFNRKIIIEKRR